MTAKYPSKNFLYLSQLRACFYCRNFRDLERMTLDHFVPRSACYFLLGGGGVYWHRKRYNIVLACKPCNQAKKARMPTPEECRRYELLFDREAPTVESLKAIDAY